MDRDRFRRLVRRAFGSLPPDLRERLENVEVVLRREPSPADLQLAGVRDGGTLFGLYVGTPRTERDDYNLTLPDRIVIFQGPLERHFHPREIPGEVRKTVIHELAHHFGIDDRQLDTLGLG